MKWPKLRPWSSSQALATEGDSGAGPYSSVERMERTEARLSARGGGRRRGKKALDEGKDAAFGVVDWRAVLYPWEN